MSNKEVPNAADIVEAFQNGSLTELIFTNFGYLNSANIENLILICAELHNNGSIDILASADSDILADIEPRQFFVGQHFFCKIIPLLDAPLDDVITAVASLVEKGGHDLAANEPHRAFREWCAGDIERCHEIIVRAKEEDPTATRLLTFALEAGELADEAMVLIETASDRARMSAVTALGRMTYEGPEIAQTVLQCLNDSLEEYDDDLFACNILLSALSIAKRSESDWTLPRKITKLVSKRGGSKIPRCCARALFRHGATLPAEIVGSLLGAFTEMDPLDEALIRELDRGLRTLLETTSHRDRATAFVFRLLTSSDGALDGSDFESFGKRLAQEPKQRLWRTLISWLLSSQRVVCQWVPTLASGFTSEDAPDEIPQNTLLIVETERETLFLARKIVGYFFLQPLRCTSLLLSILSSCEEHVAEAVGELLVDPVLINYRGTVQDYLEKIPEDHNAYSYVQNALEKGDEFSKGIPPPDAVKELHPSEHERQIQRDRISAEMALAFKQAQEESPLLSLVRRTHVLYGRRSLAYFDVGEGSNKPIEVPLQAHEVSFELPLMQVVDPVGIEYQLRVLQLERIDA